MTIDVNVVSILFLVMCIFFSIAGLCLYKIGYNNGEEAATRLHQYSRIKKRRYNKYNFIQSDVKVLPVEKTYNASQK